MEAIKRAFALSKAQNRTALITYVTAGFPSLHETAGIMLAMQAGGADIIELGIPFTDPMVDEPAIQRSNAQALENGVRIPTILQMVKSARHQGLAVPVLLMGYCNIVYEYPFGEEKFLRDCKAAGVDGFIIVDFPEDEAARFSQACESKGSVCPSMQPRNAANANYRLSYVPLIAPTTSDSRMEKICSSATSFVHVLSCVAPTGAQVNLDDGLGNLLDRVYRYTRDSIPIAVGFGINTRDDFLEVARFAEGVVVGSQIVSILEMSPQISRKVKVKEYCLDVAGRSERNIIIPERPRARQLMSSTTVYLSGEDGANDMVLEPEQPKEVNVQTDAHTRFGNFGGQYIPEALRECLAELETAWVAAKDDPAFWAEIESHASYINRPSSLHLASRLTEHVGGANIWLKREDLNHTGSYKINNALGQILLARRLGKTSIIAETGAGQHGVAIASICAQFGLKCTIFMGTDDVERQNLNVFSMRLHGATVVPVDGPHGKGQLFNAVSQAFRAWIANVETTHYAVGSVLGPHPYPTIVRTLQSVIGNETRAQFQSMNGKLPDAVVACVGGGSNAAGMFHAFLKDLNVLLVGVEGGGVGEMAGEHSATLTRGSVGVLHGVRSYVLQDKDGQIQNTHSISPGLNYPGVGPELSNWKDSGRAKFFSATDEEVLSAFTLLCKLEGIMPALESSHAIAGALKVARDVGVGGNVIVCLSGRGEKDIQTVVDFLPALGLRD
ncbi:unnamed protein product [Penicillium salamii]|nr:unnamed protein product [Penicillium salamii]CAG8314248.1 unnamed protein product [Penicillium salamii]CAG8409090.1 unnamed protein product [Penicillium salamii]